jgi:branched-chain amino acid transport system ATP-binding protein
MLRTDNLTVRFGGHVAVNAVTCTFKPGELTAVVGPNGAGKTTYFNLISGQIRASAGTVHLEEDDITAFSVAHRAKIGLGRAFQLTNLFPNLSVHENVRLALQAKLAGAHRGGLNMWSIWSDHSDLNTRADALLHQVALYEKRTATVASLPHGDQRKLEVGLMMALDPKVYMFDEPTAGMGADDVPVVLDLIRKLKADARFATSRVILLVEHKMDVIRELADRIIVLHNGALVADGKPAEVMALPVVQEAYLGIVPNSPAHDSAERVAV